METEIKLLLDPSARSRIEDYPAFATTGCQTEHLVATYFDTPDFRLRREGLSVRVRRAGRGFTQTVKLDGGPDLPPASRGEWEWPVRSGALDVAAIAAEPDVSRRVDGALDALEPLFVTDVRRTTWRLELEGTSTIEAAIDEGTVEAGERRTPIRELELELKGGPPGPLFRFARELARRADLRLGPDSKAERGYGLLDADAAPPREAGDLAFDRDIALAEAVPTLMARSVRAFTRELTAAGRGDVEGIHRLRAAVRKLRSLLALFAPHLDAAEAARFDDELRAIGAALGHARDWDVFDAQTCAAAEVAIGTDAVARLRAAAAGPRANAHAAIRAMLDGPRPTDLALGLYAWTADGTWLARARPAERLRDRLPHLLDRLDAKVRQRGRHLRRLDAEGLHDLRKALKKLRYASEDAASLFKAKAVRAHARTCKAVLQDLGEINDAAVTADRIAGLPTDRDPDLAASASALLAWIADRRARVRGDLPRRWRRFRRATPFWA